MENKFLSEILDKINPNRQTGRYDTGLVLSGGAARGFAHLGVIKFLQEEAINSEIVSGVSAGSIVGSLYCDGYEPEEILEIFEKSKIFEFVRVFFRKNALFSMSGLKKVLEQNLRAKKMEDLKKPLIIAATDIKKGETRYFSEGNLVERVIASSSIPVIFKPVKIEGSVYVDGGVTNNFPVEPLEKSCKNLIGVHVNPTGKFDEKKGLRHIALYSFHLSVAGELTEKKKGLKYFIEPPELKDYSYFEIKNAREMFEYGYNEAKAVIRGEDLKNK